MTSRTEKNLHPKLFTATFTLIIAISMGSFLMGQGANAGTSVYLSTMGQSSTLAGIGAMAFSFAAALSRIFSGGLVDVRGRQIIMIFGTILMIAGSAMPLLINEGPSFIAWRILQGVGFAATTTAAATAAADVLPIARLGEGIGYYGLGQAISMAIGPALALFLISTDLPESFYIGLTCCSILAFFLSLACRYEKDPMSLPETSEYRMRYEKGDLPNSDLAEKQDSKGESKKPNFLDSVFEPKAIPGTIPMMFIATSFGFGIFFTGVLGSSLGVASPGVFFSLAAISMIAVRLLSGKFMDRTAPIKIMGVAVVAGLITFSILYLCTHLESSSLRDTLFYSAGIFYGVSLGIATPINQTVAVKLSPAERWGAANGLYLLGTDLAIGVASFVWGITNEVWGFQTTILIVICFIALSFFAAYACYPKTEPSNESSEAK